MADRTFDVSDELFVSELLDQVRKARAKFPQPNPTVAALTEEVGELAQALLHIREGKHNDWWRVWDEAIQVACMALRAATEGDPTIGATPTAENAK